MVVDVSYKESKAIRIAAVAAPLSGFRGESFEKTGQLIWITRLEYKAAGRILHELASEFADARRQRHWGRRLFPYDVFTPFMESRCVKASRVSPSAVRRFAERFPWWLIRAASGQEPLTSPVCRMWRLRSLGFWKVTFSQRSMNRLVPRTNWLWICGVCFFQRVDVQGSA